MTLERKVTLLLLNNLLDTYHWKNLTLEECDKINDKIEELTNEFLNEILL